MREAARKARDVARSKNQLEAAPLVGKLSSCTGRNPEQNELFIVEGDSAGGSAKQGRDRRFQAILPLRGKPLNAEKKRLDQVLANEEFRSIITALGTGIDESFSLDNLKYHKVIILSRRRSGRRAHPRDPAHVLLPLYARTGHRGACVYRHAAAVPRDAWAGNASMPMTTRNCRSVTQDKKNYTIQRYKGLGEMNPEQLWETTMNPQNRKLLQVTIEDAAEVEHRVSVLMGDKVEPRREYISQYANFNREDTFTEIAR